MCKIGKGDDTTGRLVAVSTPVMERLPCDVSVELGEQSWGFKMMLYRSLLVELTRLLLMEQTFKGVASKRVSPFLNISKKSRSSLRSEIVLHLPVCTYFGAKTSLAVWLKYPFVLLV